MDSSIPSVPSETTLKTIPLGVKIIAVFYYLVSIFEIFGGIMLFIGAGFLAGGLTSSLPIVGFFGSLATSLVAALVLALGLLSFFIGRGLWQGKHWARIVAIVFAALGVLSALSSIFRGDGGTFSLIIQAVILGYLWFSQSVKSAFQK